MNLVKLDSRYPQPELPVILSCFRNFDSRVRTLLSGYRVAGRGSFELRAEFLCMLSSHGSYGKVNRVAGFQGFLNPNSQTQALNRKSETLNPER